MAVRIAVLAAAVVVVLLAVALWRRPPRVSRVDLASLGIRGAALVQFGTPQCAPCKRNRPYLERLAALAGLEFVDVDLERHPELSERYRIRSVPVVLLADPGGAVLGRWHGAPPQGELRRLAQRARAA